VTRKAIINSIPNLHIYPSRFGQNWQILLPISEKYSCHYLDKCHYKYVVREGSHSRINKDDVQKKLRLFDGHKDILINSVSKIRLANKESVLLEIADKYERKKMYLYIEQGFDKLAEKHFTSLKRKQLRDFVFIYLMKTKLYSLVKGIKRKLKVGYEKVH
jgi:glycogen synthase